MSPAIVLVFLSLITFVLFRIYKFYEPYLVLPGPPMWSFLKLIFRKEKTMNEAVYNMFRDCEVNYREVGLNVYIPGFWPLVIVHDSDSMQMILKDPTTFIKGRPYQLLRPWLGRSTLTTNRTTWKERRRLLIPGFHACVLQGFTPIIQRRAKELVQKLETIKTFDALPLFSQYTLGTLCENMMGYQLTEDKLDTEYCESVKEATRLFCERIFSPLDTFDIIYNRRASGKAWKEHVDKIRTFCAKIVRERKEILMTKLDDNSNLIDKKFQPVLDTLFASQMTNDSITDEMIIDEVNGLVFAGHDSTALTLAMGMYVISKHPHVLLKIKEELRSILGSNKERDWTYEDLSKMVYLEATIKEGLRLYTMSEISRVTMKDVTIKGYRIPKGSVIMCDLLGSQRDPKLFPDPNAFKPERFLDESGRSIIKPNGFMPFLLSPRQCIGQHYGMQVLKITAAELARHFSLRPLSKSPKLGYCIANKPMSPLMIEIDSDPI